MTWDSSYATEQAEKLVVAVSRREPGSDLTWTFAEYLLQAYRAGHRRGLEVAHKAKWNVVAKDRRKPNLTGAIFSSGLSYEVALQVTITANRVHPDEHTFFEMHPSPENEL